MTENFVKPQWIFKNLINSYSVIMQDPFNRWVFPHAGAETIPQSRKILKQWQKFLEEIFSEDLVKQQVHAYNFNVSVQENAVCCLLHLF